MRQRAGSNKPPAQSSSPQALYHSSSRPNLAAVPEGLDLRSRNLRPLLGGGGGGKGGGGNPNPTGGGGKQVTLETTQRQQRGMGEEGDDPPMPANLEPNSLDCNVEAGGGEPGLGGGDGGGGSDPSMSMMAKRNRLASVDMLDTDLYDRISYLDLKQRERARQRKVDHLENIRRLREDADRTLSARLSARSVGKPALSLSPGACENPNESGSGGGGGGSAPIQRQKQPSGGRGQVGGGLPPDDQPGGLSSEMAMVPEFPPGGDINIRHIWSEAIDLADIRNVEDQTEFRSLRTHLGIDRISLETLSRYNIRGHMDAYDHPAICYPRYRGPATRNRLPTGLKVIRRVGDHLDKENYPEAPPRFSGIFGLGMISTNDNRVVLTTNERDALAVYEATNGIPALSLPDGEHVDMAVLPYLEDFDLIYLWFPSIHERFAKDYASYLNASRCYIVARGERPVELVRDNRAREVLHGIQEAVRVRYRGFRSLIDIRDEVKQEIVQSKSRLSGIAHWKRYEVLNHYLRGFRPSEITVLTGGTGLGKTTFMCEYSMDLYTQGVRTLFCSFEVPEEKMLKWMIIQFAGLPLHRIDHHHSVEMWLDRFERSHSDLVIMKVEDFRHKTVKELADAIRDQVIAGGIQHVVIDNLQFFLSLSAMHDQLSPAEKISVQDRFIGLLRRIANDYGPHITIVVHPRAADELSENFDLHRLGGSTRIFQEADNLLAIVRQRDDNDRRRFQKFLQILKNRYGGRRAESDQIEMVFQPSTYTHTLIEYQPRH